MPITPVLGAPRQARGAVAAAILALKPILGPKGTKLYTDHILVNQVGAKESVMVASTFQDDYSDTPVVGSALAYTIDDFSSKLRDEIDLGTLNDELVGVVHQTMHPTHVSVWLRPTR